MSSQSLRAVPLTGARGVLVRPKPGFPLPPDFTPLRLVLLPSGYNVEIHRLDTVLGRHTDADIRVPLPDVSRHHCRFLWLAGSWKVIDLKSLNGIRVNGEAVPQAILNDGDELRIGGFTFRVEVVAASVAEEPIHPLFPAEPTVEERRLAS
jgi:pSer/pThr/pTyr-binding forkhead associated (FHA) protein